MAAITASTGRGRRLFDYGTRAFAFVYLISLLTAVVVYKVAFIEMIRIDPYFAVYGLIVCAYIVSRFILSVVYRSSPDVGLEPTVAVVTPAFNEEDAIADSIRAVLALDYPEEKLQMIVINDGSSDDTLAAINSVADVEPRVEVIDFPQNRGKRAAMAAGMRRADDAEIIAFVDSDSVVDPDAMRILLQGFADPEVGAMAGHADVLNPTESWLAKMQAVRYFVAFKVSKAAESVFGTVTCCSGCFAAYRREAILPHLDAWEHQRFLGRDSTYGDDRSLTNHVLRDWKVRYEVRAVSRTLVPATFMQFMHQQIRWKRSWTRESLRVASFIWRKNPAAALATYAGILLPIVAPVTAVRAVFFAPVIQGAGAPLVYLLGIYSMAVAYGLYYAMRQSRYDTMWVYGIVFVFFYLAILLWQTYWAILTARSSTWGTRESSSADEPAPAVAQTA